MIKATLRLFNAVQIKTKNEYKHNLGRTIKNGYILDPFIPPDEKLLNKIEQVIGISGEKANAAFHKSWSVVQDTPMELLVTQQVIHYITTYGFEALGIYREDAVYIPREELNLPEITEDIPLTVIRALTKREILDKIVKLGSSIALAQETLEDIMVIVKSNKYGSDFIKRISNRELTSLLNDYYDIVPSEPVDYLRYVISKLTDESLLIKNKYLIEKIKSSNGKFLDHLLKKAPDELASIFYRYKPIFLAMKSISNNKTFFNKLRKKAKKLHVPLPVDYLNSITTQIKKGTLNFKQFENRLEKAPIFRKIRLLNALKYRLNYSNPSIVYRVRNGKGWATNFHWDHKCLKTTDYIATLVLESITRDISKNVKGKTIYIPPNIHYGLPATEKQFTGNLPSGTYVTVPEDLIVGVHWTNLQTKRIDLDLSVIGVSGKIGWDDNYRSHRLDVLFSGDVTDAPKPHGASELFYIRKGSVEPRILMLNYYNFDNKYPVDCKILVAQEKAVKFGNNYMVDVNNIVASATAQITRKQNVLGLIWNFEGTNRIYFAHTSVGNSITASRNQGSAHTRHYLFTCAANTVDLNYILSVGATVVNEKPIEGEYMDLSPENLSKETFLDLINPTEETNYVLEKVEEEKEIF